MANPLHRPRVHIEIFHELVQALGWEACVIAPLFILFGYVIFGMVGFGSTIINTPLLAHLLPLRFIAPLTLLLDLFAAISVGMRMRGEVDRSELRRILPFVLLGLALGLALLISLPERALLLAPFAGFGLFLGNRLHQRLSARHIMVFVYVLIVRAW